MSINIKRNERKHKNIKRDGCYLYGVNNLFFPFTSPLFAPMLYRIPNDDRSKWTTMTSKPSISASRLKRKLGNLQNLTLNLPWKKVLSPQSSKTGGRTSLLIRTWFQHRLPHKNLWTGTCYVLSFQLQRRHQLSVGDPVDTSQFKIKPGCVINIACKQTLSVCNWKQDCGLYFQPEIYFTSLLQVITIQPDMRPRILPDLTPFTYLLAFIPEVK